MQWEAPYMTLKDDYIEAAWWTLKQAMKKTCLRWANARLTGAPAVKLQLQTPKSNIQKGPTLLSM